MRIVIPNCFMYLIDSTPLNVTDFSYLMTILLIYMDTEHSVIGYLSEKEDMLIFNIVQFGVHMQNKASVSKCFNYVSARIVNGFYILFGSN